MGLPAVAEVVIPVSDVETFLNAEPGEFDALLFIGEALAIYGLLHPGYAVVVPKPGFPSVPAAFMVPREANELHEVVDGWIKLKQSDGTIDVLFDYWVRGTNAVERAPRWSVIRDLLHWVP